MNKENLSKLSEVIGMEVAMLEDALTSEGKELSLPELYNSEKVNQIKENIKKEVSEERYIEGRNTEREILLKKQKQKFREKGIEVDGIKDFDSLFTTVIEAEKSKLTGDVDEKVKTLSTEKESLQEKLQRLESEKEDIIKASKKAISNYLIDDKLKSEFAKLNIEAPSHLSDEDKIKFIETQKQNALILFKAQHQLELDEKNNLITKKGEDIIKDKLENPEKAETIIKSFAAANFLLSTKGHEDRQGRGGSSSKTGLSGLAEVADINQLYEYAEKKGVKKGSREFDKIYAEWKK